MNLDDVLQRACVGDIRCRLAESRADFLGAFRLLYQRYLAAELILPNPVGARIAPEQLQPGCQVLVAETGRRIVGTVSLISDEQCRLPAERVFPDSVLSLKNSGARVIEIGCLASLDDSGRFPSPVYLALTRATIAYARRSGSDRLLVTVHPRHAKFYERAMGFARLTGEAPCHAVNGRPAVCLAGSPDDPHAYREPWRQHFFGPSRIDRPRGGRGMSAIDRRYFAQVKELIDRSQEHFTRSAA